MMAKEVSQNEVVTTRKQMKKKKRKIKKVDKLKNPKRIRIRLIPIWLRLLLFILLLVGSLVGGLMVGYGIIGGGNPKDVLQKETWIHIIDLVEKTK